MPYSALCLRGVPFLAVMSCMRNPFFFDFSAFRPTPPMDVSIWMESCRRNMKNFAEIQQMSMDGAQVLTRSYAQLMADIVAGQSDLWRLFASNDDRFADKMGDQILCARDMLNTTAARLREISDIAHQSRRVVGDAVRSRLADHMVEVKTALDRAQARRR